MLVATGVSDHIGWAELVTLADRGDGPGILDRRRVELIAAGLPSAPYHRESLALPPDEAETVVRRTRASVVEHCRRALAGLGSAFRIDGVIIRDSPYRELPEAVPDVLASWPMTCAADGMLYREALAGEARAAGLVVLRMERGVDPVAAAAGALGCDLATIERLLDRFGRSVGRPWRREHRRAAALALWGLAGGARVRPPDP
jgi:hypothetical protein